ncbi:MAG: class I SAM-dependent methyltransferase, partial [Oscillospiraceae bacterium]|nr:class I SAM-dependent methyltransferase [Oscillospiraceae bacterium]
VVFMDARRKKLAFISDALEEIGVDGTFLHSRAEDANRQEEHRRAYDVVTARAVASLPKLCQWALPFLRRGGVFLAMKGSTVHDETADAAKILPKLGGEITGIFPVALDKEIGERFIVRVEVN